MLLWACKSRGVTETSLGARSAGRMSAKKAKAADIIDIIDESRNHNH